MSIIKRVVGHQVYTKHQPSTRVSKGSSEVNKFKIDTDSGTYNTKVNQRILYEDLIDLRKGDSIVLKSYTQSFGDFYSYLLYNIYDVVLALTNLMLKLLLF